ncbi:hypothetical protein [Sphingomonas rubra]|uniref:Uncharacterized protein n=1 Tax=Sphingomonas rubra TaxID=634430 RepID=A0A1I5RUP6_9SPHN|nr:hypothetical protein [Sphingomonas rubra]SFP62289.1 hypothetical protein SAMN04488241_104142 [Sphingomonas rubra]
MGRTYLHTLGNCDDKGAILAIKCGRCGRVVYVAPNALLRRAGRAQGHFLASAYLTAVERVLVCRGGQGTPGCGAKSAGIHAVWDHEIPGVPKGVPPLLWLNADDRERKRLVRQARG